MRAQDEWGLRPLRLAAPLAHAAAAAFEAEAREKKNNTYTRRMNGGLSLFASLFPCAARVLLTRLGEAEPSLLVSTPPLLLLTWPAHGAPQDCADGWGSGPDF